MSMTASLLARGLAVGGVLVAAPAYAQTKSPAPGADKAEPVADDADDSPASEASLSLSSLFHNSHAYGFWPKLDDVWPRTCMPPRPS